MLNAIANNTMKQAIKRNVIVIIAAILFASIWIWCEDEMSAVREVVLGADGVPPQYFVDGDGAKVLKVAE